MTRCERIEVIDQEVQTMSAKGFYCWFSKCGAGGSVLNARRALRILLVGE